MLKRSGTTLFGIALCWALTWAAAAQVTDTQEPVELASLESSVEGSGFQVYEHGVWPEAGLPLKAPTNIVPRKQPGATKRSRGKFRLSRSAASRRAIYLPSIQAAEQRYDLPHGLLDALIWQESRYNPIALSSAGAGGLTQLMPGTASDLGVRNRFEPAANIDGGARYLRQMLNKFGKIPLALAAYNAGPGAVGRAKGIPRNGETPDYVRNVLGRWTESIR